VFVNEINIAIYSYSLNDRRFNEDTLQFLTFYMNVLLHCARRDIQTEKTEERLVWLLEELLLLLKSNAVETSSNAYDL